MKKTNVGLALIIGFVSAMSGQAVAVTPLSDAQLGCEARATQTWGASSGRGPAPTSAPFRIEAFTAGPQCAQAQATIMIKDRTQRVVFRTSYIAENVATLSDANTKGRMQSALTDWINGAVRPQFYAGLPNWQRGAAAPEAREFGFTPAPGITRATYATIKANRNPVFCYVQGIETLNCLVVLNNRLVPFGLQAFPG